jgi:glycosyltransferase involved in cell wall biosynthesis
MAPEFLSINIPTRNRSAWLKIALGQMANELESFKIGPDVVRIHISDNCSTDNTAEVVKEFQARLPHLSYSCNETNIGADGNILHCARLGRGRYHWVMGDDDSICPGALPYILDCLKKNQPALFINSDGPSAPGFKLPALFKNYREFALCATRVNPRLLIAHSLITANIFLAECFDYEFAMSKIETFYGHMYGLVANASDTAGGVYITERMTIKVRNSSTDAVDGIWPPNLEKMWTDYLIWIKEKFGLEKLQPEKIHTHWRIYVLRQFQHRPISTSLSYAKTLVHAQTYRTIWKLIAG